MVQVIKVDGSFIMNKPDVSDSMEIDGTYGQTAALMVIISLQM